jgi:PAT family beta-lactamase induction signal transducer AmpG
MILAIAAVSVLPLAAAFAMNEGSRGQEASAARPSLLAFIRRPEARQILWIALIYRASEGLVKAMEGSYLVDAGIPLDVIGYISGLSAATAGLAGSAVAAWLIQRTGLSAVLRLLGSLRTLCFLLFALHALGMLVGLWPLLGAAGFQTLIRYMEIVALYSLFMSVTTSDQPGTDFTILACAQLVVYLIGSMLSGRIADALGYGALFGIASALSLVAVLATVRMLVRARPAGMPA